MNLNIKKGPDPDGTSPSIILGVKVLLNFIFNPSLASGIFPALWKESYIVPSFKTGDRRDISCYRAVSILSALPIFFEKMVCYRITPIIRNTFFFINFFSFFVIISWRISMLMVNKN
jgi:hypothetical protein